MSCCRRHARAGDEEVDLALEQRIHQVVSVADGYVERDSRGFPGQGCARLHQEALRPAAADADVHVSRRGPRRGPPLRAGRRSASSAVARCGPAARRRRRSGLFRSGARLTSFVAMEISRRRRLLLSAVALSPSVSAARPMFSFSATTVKYRMSRSSTSVTKVQQMLNFGSLRMRIDHVKLMRDIHQTKRRRRHGCIASRHVRGRSRRMEWSRRRPVSGKRRRIFRANRCAWWCRSRPAAASTSWRASRPRN